MGIVLTNLLCQTANGVGKHSPFLKSVNDVGAVSLSVAQIKRGRSQFRVTFGNPVNIVE